MKFRPRLPATAGSQGRQEAVRAVSHDVGQSEPFCEGLRYPTSWFRRGIARCRWYYRCHDTELQRAGHGPGRGAGRHRRGGHRRARGGAAARRRRASRSWSSRRKPAVAAHQTGHNSGVVHAGIYYAPGSAKAKMTRRGVGLLRDYCAERGLAYDERGKLVVARNEAETVKLRELERRSQTNGVPGVRWLTGAGAARARAGRGRGGRAALPDHRHRRLPGHRPLVRGRRGRGGRPGADLAPRSPRCGCASGRRGWRSTRRAGAHRLSRLVICAGLQADLLAATVGDTAAPEIIPFRGEYLRLRPHAAGRVRRLIYPVPDPRYPFLGVHLTPRVDGTSDLGPNAVLALAREGYRRTDVTWDELARLARSAAFRRLARQHWMTGVREYARVAGAARLPRRGQDLPALADAGRRDQRARRGAGPGGRPRRRRSSTTSASARSGRSPSVRNAPSPAATASMAIAEHIVAELKLPLDRER